MDTAFISYIPKSFYGMVHPDHLATLQKMTDGTGTIVWSADYLPFGVANVTISAITNNLRFPGQYYDVETNLNYNYFRDYNPVIGRYVEADPSGIYKGENHLYVYVKNNTNNLSDPKGLDSGLSGMGIGGEADPLYDPNFNPPPSPPWAPTCAQKCSRSLGACYLLASAAGYGTRFICAWGCNYGTGGTMIWACGMYCTTLGVGTANYMYVGCFRAYQACMTDCKCKQ